jgi:hypothetical protein
MVCGKPVDPNVDIMLTAGNMELLPVHRGECRNTIKRGVVAMRELIEARYPVVRFMRTAAIEFLKATAPQEQPQQYYTPPSQRAK